MPYTSIHSYWISSSLKSHTMQRTRRGSWKLKGVIEIQIYKNAFEYFETIIGIISNSKWANPPQHNCIVCLDYIFIFGVTQQQQCFLFFLLLLLLFTLYYWFGYTKMTKKIYNNNKHCKMYFYPLTFFCILSDWNWINRKEQKKKKTPKFVDFFRWRLLCLIFGIFIQCIHRFVWFGPTYDIHTFIYKGRIAHVVASKLLSNGNKRGLIFDHQTHINFSLEFVLHIYFFIYLRSINIIPFIFSFCHSIFPFTFRYSIQMTSQSKHCYRKDNNKIS